MNEINEVSIVAVIPAHLASVRFPRKVLFDIGGLPMIEIVRRRALLCNGLNDVLVATCDKEVADAVLSNNGRVIMTSEGHRNGTTRVAEAIESINCSHVLLIQGDEPLLLPRHVEGLVSSMRANPFIDAWNITSLLDGPDDLDARSVVKCSVSPDGRILHCFRKSPFVSSYEKQCKFVQKIQGAVAFRKEFLLTLAHSQSSPIESAEFIEQMRILENGSSLQAFNVSPALPSVNEPSDISGVIHVLESDTEQNSIHMSVTPRLQ